MKKTLSLILALLMTVSCASTIFAADDAAIADEPVATSEAVEEAVDETTAEAATPYDRAIEFLVAYDIIHGKEDGLLHAEDAVKRYEMALFTGRIMTGWVDDLSWEDYGANDSGFTDLKGTGAENVYGAISYVSQKGVIEGYGNGIFKPEQTVSYREALTMAVRSLGYQGLEWPWGYIEKAVNLGLTDGIEGVAYTDPCNRGVVCQIIYNTLFADNSKLALQSFGTAFGWSDIVITATETAKYTTASYKTPAGYVAFQVVEDDGSLDSTIYYAKASELGIYLTDDSHADELALGTPYSVLFGIDSDDNLVSIINYDKYDVSSIKNQGITDNDGKAYEDTDPIGTYLKPLTIVDKYSGKILANAAKDDTEIIITTAGKVTEYLTFDYNKSPYAYDWSNGNILLADTDDDGNYLTTAVTDGSAYTFVSGGTKYNYTSYHVEYYYNPIEGYYFSVKYTNDGNVIGVLKMDDDELDEIKAVIDDACKIGTDKLVYVAYDGSTTLHANLDTYKTEAGLRGIYESYGFGLLKQATEWCSDHSANHVFLKINGTRVAEISDGAWYQDAYAPVLDKDGNVVSAYVIYGYNKATKEFKVIKTIEAYSDDLTDADTYYATGVLNAYSLTKATVTIGSTTYPLSQNYGTFKYSTDSSDYKNGAYKAYLTSKLEPLFAQFVTYYLLDGEVVALEAANAGYNGYIVVDSYAGISSDGYIVVNGYSTTDLKYDRFRIGSYNYWDEGDFFWYGNQVTDEFIKGQVYKVVSYDKDSDVYYVETLGELSEDGTSFDYSNTGTYVDITFSSGYRLWDDDTPKKTTSSDKYILIPDYSPTLNYMPIIVYEGKVTDDTWAVSGYAIGCDASSKTFIITNADITGFKSNESWQNSGLALVVKKTIMEKFYNGAGLDPDEWYLNGATETAETLVFNFYTGEFEYAASALNTSIKTGKVYRMVDGVLTGVVSDQTWDALWAEFLDTYTDLDSDAVAVGGDASGRWYKFKQGIDVTVDYCDGDEDALSEDVVSGLLGLKVDVTGLVSSVKVVKLVKDGVGGNVTSVEAVNKSAYNSLISGYDTDNTVIKGDLILKSNGDGTYAAVIYIDPDDCIYVTVEDDPVSVESTNALQWKDDLATGATVAAEKTITESTKDGEEVTVYDYTITSIGFNLFGSYTKNDHKTLADNNAYFDEIDRCSTLGNWDATLTVDAGDAGKLYETDIDFEIYTYHEDVTDTNDTETCKLVQSFSFDPSDVLYDGATKAITVSSTNKDGVTVTFKATLKYGEDTAKAITHTLVLSVDEDGELVVEFAADGQAVSDEVIAIVDVDDIN